jgi:hypothetical protein
MDLRELRKVVPEKTEAKESEYNFSPVDGGCMFFRNCLPRSPQGVNTQETSVYSLP